MTAPLWDGVPEARPAAPAGRGTPVVCPLGAGVYRAGGTAPQRACPGGEDGRDVRPLPAAEGGNPPPARGRDVWPPGHQAPRVVPASPVGKGGTLCARTPPSRAGRKGHTAGGGGQTACLPGAPEAHTQRPPKRILPASDREHRAHPLRLPQSSAGRRQSRRLTALGQACFRAGPEWEICRQCVRSRGEPHPVPPGSARSTPAAGGQCSRTGAKKEPFRTPQSPL